MPNTIKMHCTICRRLYQKTEKLMPRRVRYTSYAQHNFLQEETITYAGVPREGSLPGAETQALYVRDSGKYVRVGEICDVGHVKLNGEWVDLKDGKAPVEGHVVHNGTIICRHTGQLVGQEESDS